MAQPFIVDFPVNDLLLPYKEQLIEEFYEQIKTKTDPGYSCLLYTSDAADE